jgi:hypothetical protein
VGKTRDLKDISSDDVNRFLNHLRDDLGNSPRQCSTPGSRSLRSGLGPSAIWRSCISCAAK